MQTANSNPKLFRKMLARNQLSLPYSEYSPKDGIYILDDGGVAVIFECAPYGGYNAEAGLTTLLSMMPEHSAMQFILIPSRNLNDSIDSWKAYKIAPEELYQVTRDDFAAFIESKTKDIISPKAMRCLATDYKLVISLKIGGRKKEYSILKSILNIFSGKIKKTEDDDNIEKLYSLAVDLKSKMEAALQTANLFPRLMTADALTKYIFVFLNPQHDFRNIPSWQGNLNDMTDNMIANDNVIEVTSDYIKFDNMYGCSLSVKDYPKYWSCSMADQLIGQPFGSQSLESTVYLCLNIINIGKEGIAKTKRTSQLILSQNLNEYIFPRLKMKKIDLADANVQLEKGEQLFHINLAIFPIADSIDGLQNISSQVKSYYQGLGFKLEEDKYINLPILLSMLPGNYDERFASDLARGRVVFQQNVVDLALTAADWAGNTADPEIFFFTPRGQLYSFDLFASNTNYNAFVIGTSGAGKSVLLQDFAMNYLMSGGRINIIDIGGSYENFCGIVGGQYIDVKPSNPISLNPFTELTTKEIFNEFKEFLVDWYWMMGSPESQSLSEEQSNFVKSLLSRAIEASYDKYGINSDVDTVLEQFDAIAVIEKEDIASSGDKIIIKEKDIRCSDFIQILGRYGKQGDYGAFFNGKSEIKFNHNFVVLETGSMENSPALRDPILMILTYHISKSIYLSKDMKQKKLIIIDEAHKFLGNHRVDGFIEQAYRRFRKHGASMIIGTQGWEDLSSESSPSRAGRVIVENSAFQIIMTQSYASREKLKQSESHQFTDYDKAMIDSISSVKGEFSEALLIADKNKVKIRIVLSDFMKKTFFTSPKVRTYINQQVAQGVPLLEAVNSVPAELLKS